MGYGQISLHGVFLSIFNAGVLLVGKSQIGKSELALALVDRGHKLIADDVVYFSQTDQKKANQKKADQKTLIGSAPKQLRNFMQINQVGVINVRYMYSEKQLKEAENLHIVIRLTDDQITHDNLLTMPVKNIKILDVKVPEIAIDIEQHKRADLLTEMIVRKFLLKQKNYDTEKDFLSKHKKQLAMEVHAL